MTDEEFIAGEMRIRAMEGSTALEVAVVGWQGVHKVRRRWRAFRKWTVSPSDEEIAAAKSDALADPRYFRRCHRCGELQNAGYMHDDRTCMACAEQYFGVVH
jgi:hypothetical protein